MMTAISQHTPKITETDTQMKERERVGRGGGGGGGDGGGGIRLFIHEGNLIDKHAFILILFLFTSSRRPNEGLF